MAVEQKPDVDAAAVPSDALADARAKRADLHTVIVALEEANAAPVPGRSHEWFEGVHDGLVEVAGAFERHIAAVEGPDGLFDQVTQASPRLANAVQRLREEHLEIRAQIIQAIDAVRVTADALPTTEDSREIVLTVLDQLMRHRQHGADLVYDAYAVDIGTGD